MYLAHSSGGSSAHIWWWSLCCRHSRSNTASHGKEDHTPVCLSPSSLNHEWSTLMTLSNPSHFTEGYLTMVRFSFHLLFFFTLIPHPGGETSESIVRWYWEIKIMVTRIHFGGKIIITVPSLLLVWNQIIRWSLSLLSVHNFCSWGALGRSHKLNPP